MKNIRAPEPTTKEEIGGRTSPRAVLFALTCALGLLALGCGLPQTTTYYSAPTLTASNPPEIDHNTGNTESGFEGYVIYYRVYGPDSSALATQDAAALLSEINVLNSSQTPDVIIPQLTGGSFTGGRTFSQMTISTTLSSTPPSTQQPILPVSSSEQGTAVTFFINLNLPLPNSWYYTKNGVSSVTSNGIYLTRAAVFAGHQNASFYNAATGITWQSGDGDFTGATVSGNTNALQIVAFVAGYGLDTSALQTKYGFPAAFSTPLSFAGN